MSVDVVRSTRSSSLNVHPSLVAVGLFSALGLALSAALFPLMSTDTLAWILLNLG